MALIGTSSFGNLKNKDGTLGKTLLSTRESADSLARQITDALETIVGCIPNTHSIFADFPRWIQNRDSQANLIEFFQAYYDWLYCKSEDGAQYPITSSDFFNVLNINTNSIEILKKFALAYASEFPQDKIGNDGSNKGITSDYFADFLTNIRTNFYQTKGSEVSYAYFFKKLYGTTLAQSSIDYPKKRILRLNGGKFPGWDSGFTGPTGSYEQVSSLGGSYLNNGVIRDGYFYQDYSYIINTGNLSDYDPILLSILHPMGMLAFFEQSIEDYVPIGPSGDYEEGLEPGCEISVIGNYLPYQINATGDLEPCVGCSGSSANLAYFSARGISDVTYDMPTYNHPGWYFAGEPSESIGDIDKYDSAFAFKNLPIGSFFVLCGDSPNDGISACGSGSDELQCA